MTASELLFLALGLGLGIVSGAALVEVLRTRPPVPRPVRVTVQPDAIPRRRPSTLSEDAFLSSGSETAPGGPADRRTADRRAASGGADRRTIVRSGPGVPVFAPAALTGASAPDRVMTAAPPTVERRGTSGGTPAPSGEMARPSGGMSGSSGSSGSLVGIPVAGGDDPVLAALRVHAVSSAMRAGPADLDGHAGGNGNGSHHTEFPALGGEAAPVAIATAVAVMERPMAVAEGDRRTGPTDEPMGQTVALMHDEAGPEAATPPAAEAGEGAVAEVTTQAGSAGGAAPVAILDATDPCAGERRIAAERCGLAVRARVGANEAADAVRLAQRTYDDHMSKAEQAAVIADPRAVRREKEAAQAHFRAAYNGAKTAEDAEAAARDWLTEINDINSTARAAAATAKRERAGATALGAQLERLSLEADAARIAAETAEAACLAARQALAECDERSVAGVVAPLPPAPWVERPGPAVSEDDMPLAAALSAGGTPTIFRLVRGDRTALIALVNRLGGDDPVARRRWQLTLSNLVDAIVAVSIEAGALEFPGDHTFWGTFTLIQDREISQALASLGYRFDGLGGFADERVPSQRDLSLALGYAGIDPMRMRSWPTEAEMAALYEDVSVAADEHLAATAGDLSLSELVALLGRRADGLADLWNEWGHVRPLLLEGA